MPNNILIPQPIILPTNDGLGIGFGQRIINDTGGASIKGMLVETSSAVEFAASLVVQGDPDPFGVIWSDGVPDGGWIYVVVSGIADVLFIDSTTRGQFARTFVAADGDYEIGKAKAEAVPVSPFATDKHFVEIGHILESRVGAGLAKVNIHFN